MEELRKLSRRDLLRQSVSLGTVFVMGTGFIAAPNAAWAVEVKHLKPQTMATLIQMARDIYPHDHVGDEYYAKAVKGYDSADAMAGVEAGVEALDAVAAGRGYGNYLSIGWERDRVDILRSMEQSPFFQQIRGGLIVGLYNQEAIWPMFGYEGESFSKGGYINRGFNDISWV
jgi:hypothetical protein